MKKHLGAVAALALLVTMTGCGGAAEAGSTPSSTSSQAGTRVPNVTGETVADATMDLSKVGLSGKPVGMAGEELAYGSIQQKKIVGVDPAPGTVTDLKTVQLKVDTSTGTLGPTPTPTPVTPIVADGTYIVGKTIPAGTYRTAPEVKDCYWSRMTGAGATIANDFVEFAPDGVTVTVHAGEGFKSDGCGLWTKVG